MLKVLGNIRVREIRQIDNCEEYQLGIALVCEVQRDVCCTERLLRMVHGTKHPFHAAVRRPDGRADRPFPSLTGRRWTARATLKSTKSRIYLHATATSPLWPGW